ncbi:MAG: hypothetical protein DCC55_34100 [Chloroflexi bacterium]|nr:MAG: hypothetical protein DCC55_34100 [Chloroflexota bacterium]
MINPANKLMAVTVVSLQHPGDQTVLGLEVVRFDLRIEQAHADTILAKPGAAQPALAQQVDKGRM